MWKRKKETDPQAQVAAPEQSYWAAHREGEQPRPAQPVPDPAATAHTGEPPAGELPAGEFSIPLDQLPPDIAAALHDQHGHMIMSRTTTVTSGGHTTVTSGLTADGQQLDPDSPQGRALAEALSKLAGKNGQSPTQDR